MSQDENEISRQMNAKKWERYRRKRERERVGEEEAAAAACRWGGKRARNEKEDDGMVKSWSGDAGN